MGIKCKQTFIKESKRLVRKASGYAHARQYKRLKRAIKRQRTIVGILIRELERKAAVLNQQAQEQVHQGMQLVKRLYTQRPQDKDKLYSLHAPEVECISKGKARKRYEFGVKASLVTSLKTSLVLGARTYPGNPYDGHTLKDQLQQTNTLLEALGVSPQTAVVDLGYRGKDIEAELPDMEILHRGKRSSMSKQQRTWLKRRQSIEPIIGHLKADNRMDICHLKGATGDALHTLLCACGFNIRWLLNRIHRFKAPNPKAPSFLFDPGHWLSWLVAMRQPMIAHCWA